MFCTLAIIIQTFCRSGVIKKFVLGVCVTTPHAPPQTGRRVNIRDKVHKLMLAARKIASFSCSQKFVDCKGFCL